MSAKGWLDGAPPAVQAAQRRLATIREARTRGLYHHRVHGPERATPPARVAPAPGGRPPPAPRPRVPVYSARPAHCTPPCRWSPEGALDWARCRAADGRWIGVEPGAIE